MDDRQAIDRLPMLSAAERQQLLVDWNATEAAYPSAVGIHALFEVQAASTPHAVAVVHHDREWSYATVNAQANRLAHYLRGLGVAPGMRVALLFERSIELVCAYLAVLKCGGAYMPLDQSAPAERQAFMLADCATRFVLTTTGRDLPDGAEITRVDAERNTSGHGG